MTTFVVGDRYTRKAVLAALDAPDPGGGNWYTGLCQLRSEWFIFCGIGVSGRTGHDYHNRFVGDELLWHGKTGSRATHPTIRAITAAPAVVHVFFRKGNREPFIYAGLAKARRVEAEIPVRITWSFAEDDHPHPEFPPEEIRMPGRLIEGACKSIIVNMCERDPAARATCIAHWGASCRVCDFDFARVYGDLGRGFIHVHHLVPLATIAREYALDPIRDLRPVCPNCHAMLHRTSQPRTIESLRQLVRHPND